jgi:hypothetical protein
MPKPDDDPLLAMVRSHAEETARRSESHAVLRASPEYRTQIDRMQGDALAFAQTLQMTLLTATRATNFVDNSFSLTTSTT